MKRVLHILLGVFFSCTGLAALLFFVANAHILAYRSQIAHDLSDIPTSTILVFGGGMKPDGSMSDMQTDRVLRAIELYKLGKGTELIMTGDDGARRTDEVDVMHAFAVAAGVPDEDVSTDPHGYNTYSSCYRAAHVYGIKQAVVISQTFHLYRIAYFCEGQGIDVVGVPADLRDYGWIGRLWSMNGRESLARLKGWWQMELTRPEPIRVK